ncbi:chaperone NapD [Caenispirillum salinarum]|uniref:chaperone NapD n=1 Tax=Caenispirillum salinarum TaxID=859058 RepID=UPI00384C3A4B
MRTGRFERTEPEAPPLNAALVNICGLLVHARPDRSAALSERLGATTGCEVHAATGDGRLVVVVEDTEEASALDRIRQINDWDGVAASSLVFHHFEDAKALEGEIEA